MELAQALEEVGLRLAATELSRIENGSRSARISDAVKIAEVLGIDLNDLSNLRTPAKDAEALAHALSDRTTKRARYDIARAEATEAQRRLLAAYEQMAESLDELSGVRKGEVMYLMKMAGEALGVIPNG